MKVAILSHFGTFQDSYALHVGWKERALLLQRFGVEFDFLVGEHVKPGNYPNQMSILKSPGGSFDDQVKAIKEQYLEILPKYDVILTADLVYQVKGSFLAQNAAFREASKHLKAWWCHWIHSSWVNPAKGLKYPENLRYMEPPRSFLVYLNGAELDGLSRMYNTDISNCHTVYNPKDYRSFNNFDKLSNDIIDIMDIPNKNAVQIFPFCSTRMDAKGIDGVIHCSAGLKRMGMKTALILANANGRNRQVNIDQKKKLMNSLGLVENQDYIFTSDLLNYKPLPRKSVSDLFKVSNYFVFTSWRETVGNVFQEAKISGCKLVLNKNLPCLVEQGGSDAIYIDTTHKVPGLRDFEKGDTRTVKNGLSYWDSVASNLIPQLPSLEHKWAFSFDKIWKKQFKPLIEKAYIKSKE